MPHVIPHDDFGDLLRRLRVAAHLTQEQLAERSGLSSRSVRDLERGRVRRPRPVSLRLLGDALGLSEEEHRTFVTAGRTVYWSERNPLPRAS